MSTRITYEEFKLIDSYEKAKWNTWALHEDRIPNVEAWCEQNCKGRWLIKEAYWSQNPGHDRSPTRPQHSILFENRKDRTRIVKEMGAIWRP